MKQIRRRLPSVLYTFPFLVFSFVLILISSYLLAVSGFEGVFAASLFNTPRGMLLLVVGPLVLIVLLSLFLFGMISESLLHGTGNRFRLRLFLVICSLVMTATFPQTLILGRFVSTSLGTWFDRSVTDSLVSVRDLADLYAAERIRSIERVSGRFLNGLAISNYRARPTDWMNEIRSIDAHAAACQVYSRDGSDDSAFFFPVLEIGDSARFVPRNRLSEVTHGMFTLDEGEPLYRYGQIVRYSNSTYLCVYTSLLPAGFRERLETVSAAADQAAVIEKLKPFLPLMGVWIYVLFSLPSLLMVVILAWFASSRIAEPVRSITEATARLAEGDHSFCVIPHSRDELAETASLLNSIAEGKYSKKKADKKAVIRL